MASTLSIDRVVSWGDVRGGTATVDLTTSRGADPGEDPAARFAQVTYSDIGPVDTPCVVVQGGITSDRHVATTGALRGWWPEVVSADGAIDPTRTRVVCTEPPCFSDPEERLSTAGHARAIAALLDRLQIERVERWVGASYGGMVGMVFAVEAPARLRHLVAISAPDRPHPIATAARSLQRRIVELGVLNGCADDALAIARGLAMTTYRTEEEFEERFTGEPDRHGRFPVESYLDAHGRAIVGRLGAQQYLDLSTALDRHEIEPGELRTPTTLVAVPNDRLVPWSQLARLADAIAGPCRLERLESTYGHDAFLKETTKVNRILREAERRTDFVERPEGGVQ